MVKREKGGKELVESCEKKVEGGEKWYWKEMGEVEAGDDGRWYDSVEEGWKGFRAHFYRAWRSNTIKCLCRMMNTSR